MKRFVDVVQYLVVAATVVFLLGLFLNEPSTPDGGGDSNDFICSSTQICGDSF